MSIKKFDEVLREELQNRRMKTEKVTIRKIK